MEIKSLYQILYCNLHDRKEKRHSIYLLPTVYTKSAKAEVLIYLNKVGVSVSYNEFQRARNDLALHVFKVTMKQIQSQVTSAKTNLPSVLSLIFIIVIDHLCPEYSVIMTLLWHFFKSSLNNYQIDLTKKATKGKLTFQEKQPFF